MKPEDDAAAAELRARAEAAFQKRTADSPENLEALSPEASRQLLHELRVHQIELEMQNEELRRAQGELDVSRARYFELYDLAPVGYVTLSEAGLIRQANLTAATLLGVTRSDLVQQPLSRFIQKEDADTYYLLRKKLLATGAAQSCDLQLVKNDGTSFWAHLAATVAPDESAAPDIRVVLSNITERVEAEAQIRMLNEDLERRVAERTAELRAANKEMEAFSYSVSHDLRAPLRAVDGFARMVVKKYADRLDDEGRRMLTVIRDGAQRMERLINDLLAFSKLGRETLEPSPIDMRAMAQSVFDELSAHEPERKLRLDLHPLPAARGTESMVRQVWVNLISNAIKFTKDREVGEIEIGSKEDGDDGPVYYVRDNGVGFDMRHAGKLFGVFQRLHATNEFEGTGVGLALVARVVQRHGGRAWAEAQVARGATIYFTLRRPE